MKSPPKYSDSDLDTKLAGKIVKDLEAQYPGGFARIIIIYF